MKNKLIDLLPYWYVLILAITSATIGHAEENRSFNPADPTAVASHIEIMPEYNSFTGGDARILRFVYDYDWAEGKYSVTAEVPYGQVRYDDGNQSTGIGDIRTRFFWKFYDAPGERLENMVANLDIFLPTGDSDEGLGIGTFMFAPSIIFAYPVSERFAIYPAPKFKFSTSKTKGRSSAFPPGRNPTDLRDSEEYIFAFEVEAIFMYEWPNFNAWGFVDPIIEFDLLPEPDEDNYEMTLRGQVGRMFGLWGLGLEGTTFVAGEKSQDYQVKLLFFYYF